jgi:hypothetical protein
MTDLELLQNQHCLQQLCPANVFDKALAEGTWLSWESLLS